MTARLLPALPAAGLAALALALAGCAQRGGPVDPQRVSAVRAPAYSLPAPGALSTRARSLGTGPRAIFGVPVHGRTLAMWGAVSASSRLLVAGCVNGRRCAGTDVVNSAMFSCPPDDAELWLLPSLDPRGADLDADPARAGAQAWRQAAADLRPRIAIAIPTGPRALVRAAPGAASERAARRYARLSGLSFVASAPEKGLAAWLATALPDAAGITVELPGKRISARGASRLAYALDRLAGTRFAAGAESDRRRMIRHGIDPRRPRY